MTPIGYQVTIDARDPHAQARFWAAALGYTIEDHDAVIRGLLAGGHLTDEDLVEIDGHLAFRIAAAIRHPDDLGRDAVSEPAPRRLLFQLVTDEKVAKNRVHLDLNVGRERIDAEVARLTSLGATVRYQVDEPGAFHTTMADPEGNEFCVQ